MAGAQRPNVLTVMTMNTGKAPNVRGPAANIQKRVINHSIQQGGADIVLFQEFNWDANPDGHTILHREGHIGNEYEYIRSSNSKEVGILFNRQIVTVTRIPTRARIPRPTQDLIPDVSSFDPYARMCVSEVLVNRTQTFICISWHGPAHRSGMKNLNKTIYFTRIMEFVNGLYNERRLPVIIAGDFNLTVNDIHNLVQVPFDVHATNNNMIDFYIASQEFINFNTQAVDIANHNNPAVLDHVPVLATFTLQ